MSILSNKPLKHSQYVSDIHLNLRHRLISINAVAFEEWNTWAVTLTECVSGLNGPRRTTPE